MTKGRKEALALQKLDICLTAAELTVKQAFKFDGNNPRIKTPKSNIAIMPIVSGDYLFHNKTWR